MKQKLNFIKDVRSFLGDNSHEHSVFTTYILIIVKYADGAEEECSTQFAIAHSDAPRRLAWRYGKIGNGMTTDRAMEMIVGTTYPASMRHLQQLIMDAEACAKAYGKKSFFGKDKFEPAVDKFLSTVGTCVVSLTLDGHTHDPEDAEAGIDALHFAMTQCEAVYDSWPMGFRFWNDWYRQFKHNIERENN